MSEERAEIGMIVAVSPEGAIGVDGAIPWHYPADLKRFKRLTVDSTVIMGRRTYESIQRAREERSGAERRASGQRIGRPLPNRRNIVITRSDIEGVDCFADIPSALATCTGRVWFIGGARIYREAMPYCDLIDVTYVPDRIAREDAVRFPPVDPARFEAGPLETHPDDPRLQHRIYRKK